MYINENKWNIFDVFSLLGIRTNSNKEEVYVPCPFCGGKRFAMNQRLGIGHCFNCEQSANGATYYAQFKGLSVHEAYLDIERNLGLFTSTVEVKRPERVVFKEAKQLPLAAIKDLDFTYRSFLNELTLSEKNRNSLLARGFNYEDIERLNYKTFPNTSEVDFRNICKKLLLNGCTLEGVPGFYQTKYGDWTFVQMTKGIIIPQKTVNNQIFGFQIRKDDDLRTYNEETGELEAKCAWFSSKNCRHGSSCKAEINFSCDFKFDQKTKKFWPYFKSGKILLTEGTMKADLVHSILQEDMPVMSVAGVNSTTYLEQALSYLKKLGVNSVIHAYDMDYQTNDKVLTAMKKTKKMIEDAGLTYKMLTWDTTCSINGQNKELLKGIDDYLAYLKKGIIPKIKEFDN